MSATTYATGGYAPSEAWLLWRPRLLHAGPLVVLCHGAGGTGLGFQTDSGSAALINRLADAGFHALAPRLTGTHTWGNDASTDALDASVTYAQTSLGAAAGKVFLVGASMGNITAWNYYRRFPSKVTGIAAVAGAANLAYHASGNDAATGKYQTEVWAAYTNQAGYEAAAATHDPLLFAAGLADLPFRAWHDSTDPVAPLTHIQSLAAAVGGDVVQVGSTGVHDAWYGLDFMDLLGFIADANW